jgi:hypothetical protein
LTDGGTETQRESHNTIQEDTLKEKAKEIKRYTQRAKQGVLRKRVRLPPGLKARRSEPQLNFTQPGEREGWRESGGE